MLTCFFFKRTYQRTTKIVGFEGGGVHGRLSQPMADCYFPQIRLPIWYYTNIPCDGGQYTRIFSRGTLNSIDALYSPMPTAEGNIRYPCKSLFCMCSLSPSIIYYACPNFRTTCPMVPMLTLHHELEIAMLPSIPSNGHVGGL